MRQGMALGLAALLAFPVMADAGGPGSTRTALGPDALLHGRDADARVDFSAYAPQADASSVLPRNRFEGRLQLMGADAAGGFSAIVDRYGAAGSGDSPRKHLPEFDFALVQAGSHLIPARRDSIPGQHPDWEFVLTPGRVWDEPGDGGFSRAALPFALQQKNANCIHNGVLTFLFRSDGTVSKVAYQIASETCAYFKADFWGLLPARYVPQPVEGSAALVEAYRREVAGRMPVKPLAALARDYPGVDPARFAAPNGKDPRDMSLVGLVVDGTHYVGGCATRSGTYPYCESLVVPSYSLAKSVFAGLGMMRLERLYPGAFDLRVADLVPSCAAAGWDGVRLGDALDMATGRYRSAAYMRDEDADTDSATGLFQSPDHAGKIAYACSHYPRRQAPGERWVYHTTDTYALGTAMQALLRSRQGMAADTFDSLLFKDVLAPLGVSPTADYTRRTLDDVRQPFTGWGLMWLRDDVAKIGRFLAVDGRDQAVLDQAQLEAALQRDPAQRGTQPLPGFRYKNGFWAYEIGDKLPGCRGEVWVPFMAGYGAITLLVLPNDAAYYYFSDDERALWLDAAQEAHKIRSLCP